MIESALLAATAITAAYQDYGYTPPPTPPPPRIERTTPKNDSQQAVAVIPAAPAGPRLKDIPDTTVKYFDVTGNSDKAINRSLAKQQPIDPVTKQPAMTSWSVGASFSKQTTADGQCKIVAAKVNFEASANLPRLANEEGVPAAVLAQWRAYVDALDANQAASLDFVHDRLSQVEQAMLGSSCDGVQAAASTAVTKLKQEAAAFEQQRRSSATAAKK